MEFLSITHKKIDIKDDKTNIYHTFDVPKGIKNIIIDYSYSPKTVEDEDAALSLIRNSLKKYDDDVSNERGFLPVKNLVTLSLDDANGYRGAAHRQADVQHHIISKENASAGFIKGEIIAGQWSVCLNVHCAACPITYDLKITGEEE